MGFPTQIPVSDAIEAIRAEAGLGPVERVPLERALGRTLAEPLAARADHPAADDSALDGYACRFEDAPDASAATPVALRVVGEVPAGGRYPGRIGPGEAVRIYTGAPMPDGADAIVRVEASAEDGDRVRFVEPPDRTAIRPRGQDLRSGIRYLEAGRRLDAAALALAAAMGHAEIPVRRPPRIGILATGDELVPPGGELGYGEVYDSNSYGLLALLVAAGAEATLLPRVVDDRDALAEAVAAAGGVDLLLTSGGVSMGRYDLVRDLLLEEGEVRFWKVRMKPGGPGLFGLWRGTPLLGLPGNPVSSLVVFLILGRAFIDTWLGRTTPLPYRNRWPAVAAEPFRAAGPKETFQRVTLRWEDDRPVAASTGSQSSGVLHSMALADALLILAPGARVEPGDPVEVIPLAPHLG